MPKSSPSAAGLSTIGLVNPTFRLARPSDARGCLAIYAPLVRETPISFELEPPDAFAMEARIAEALAFAPWIVAEEEGLLLAYAYATRFRAREAYRFTAESTIYVAPEARSRGIGAALYAALVDALRLAGFRSCVGVIVVPNDASFALHARAGFRRTGRIRAAGFKLGAWHDVELWQLDLADDRLAPTRTLAPRELADDPRFDALLRLRAASTSPRTQ